MLKIPAEYDRDISPEKLTDTSQISGMIITHMGTNNRLENGRSAWNAL
jgi:hypothetical protein